jgi:hypothetical protein
MKDRIRIGSGQGFWGDLPSAPTDQATRGPIDYLVLDYLAEVTMSILRKQMRRDPALGYAKDVVPLMHSLLPLMEGGRFRVVTNGGGVNPKACAAAILAEAKQLGRRGLKIGVVTGDDILDRVDEFVSQGIPLSNMETGEPVATVRERLLSANVYFGAGPIVEALRQGADVVITGRTTDTGLTLAPMIHEFGWRSDDWDRLAAGTVAGHILECGGQASGGNFLGDWRSVPDLADIGFPIAEAHADGRMIITKHEGTGGLVSSATVKEQLLYEIGDPRMYITPDCVADFTTIRVEDGGSNRVLVHGVKGQPATEFYKVSMAYLDGYTAFGTLTYAWPDALEKAKSADLILRARLEKVGLRFEEIRTEYLGHSSSHGHLSTAGSDPEEVVFRIGVKGSDPAAIERFGMEIAPLILTGPPSVTGFAGGRPKPSEVISYWPALIPKSAVQPMVEIFEA